MEVLDTTGTTLDIIIFGNEEQSWRTRTTWFQDMLYKAIVIKIVWYWHKDRHTDQWNRLESPKIDQHKNGQLIFDTCAKAIQ